MGNDDDQLTLAEAAELLGLSPGTLRMQVKAGRLGARLFGKTWVTTRAEVEDVPSRPPRTPWAASQTRRASGAARGDRPGPRRGGG
jgi:excisionase family DNA binding protein